jgi:hypothetical protein
VDSTIEFIVQSDGTFLISVGTSQENQLIEDIFRDLIQDCDQLGRFFKINESEVIVGNEVMCG